MAATAVQIPYATASPAQLREAILPEDVDQVEEHLWNGIACEDLAGATLHAPFEEAHTALAGAIETFTSERLTHTR